jgi:putative transcriptional regulator
MGDPRFSQSVVCICSHDEEGALGLVINQPIKGIAFPKLAEQLNLPQPDDSIDLPVRQGGPVEGSRGFLLHSSEFAIEGATIQVTEGVAMTATLDALAAVAKGEGPSRAILCLGYAGWSEGQLERELQENAWLTVAATPELVFNKPGRAWADAITAIGIDPRLLSADGGRA